MSAPAERLRMSEAWRQWEGEVVDDRFLLQRFLGSSDHSAVFLTEIGQPPQKAALKFMEANSADARLQLARWERAAKLSHPHLIRTLYFGSCRLGRASMLYVVSEFAEENLSQILPARTLSPSEAEFMLRSVLEALAYLHGQGLAHGRLKPANIMAVDEKLKISSDGICKANEKLVGMARTVYGPPEATTSGLSPAGDVWSLGVILVEALTQKTSLGEGIRQGDPLLPETVPPPFLDIARQCLRLDPQRRWTVPDIAARLLPTAPPPQKSFARRYGLAAALLALVTGAAIMGQRLVSGGHDTHTPQPQVSESAPAPSAAQNGTTENEQRAPSAEATPATPAAPTPSTTVPSAPPGTAESGKPVNTSPEPAHASPEAKSDAAPAPAAPSKDASALSSAGAVEKRVLPPVSQRSRNTINGKVRVAVKVDVDATGKVARARLESAGPSQYFARLAEDASRQWKFQPPQLNGEAVPSQWLLRYAFGRSGTDVQLTQLSPHK
jgi:TonB family protein